MSYHPAVQNPVSVHDLAIYHAWMINWVLAHFESMINCSSTCVTLEKGKSRLNVNL